MNIAGVAQAAVVAAPVAVARAAVVPLVAVVVAMKRTEMLCIYKKKAIVTMICILHDVQV